MNVTGEKYCLNQNCGHVDTLHQESGCMAHNCGCMNLVDAPKSDARTLTTDESWEWAKKFHEVYERLAPEFGYKTRPESAKSWEEIPQANRQLMMATVATVLEAYALPIQQQRDAAQAELHLWKVALHDLTAGGSEFANDLGACVAYVRNRYSTQHELIKKSIIAKNKAESESAALRTTLEWIVRNFYSATDADEIIAVAEAALEEK